jgi:hypothetical protein
MLKTKYLLLCASLLFTSTVFTACNDDDDSSSSTEKLLKSETRIRANWSTNEGVDTTKLDSNICNFIYNAEGKLIEINSNGENSDRTVITYKGNSIISKSTYTGGFVEANLKIGDSGYIEWSESKESYNGELRIDTTLCSYNNGYLVKRISKSIEPCTAIYTYENGNLKTVNYKWSDTEYENNSFYYTDNYTKTPIPNRSSSTVDEDGLDPMGSMLGKHSTNLPVKHVEKHTENSFYDECTTYYTWTLDADGYPIKCVQKGYNQTNVLSEYEITTYTWQ